MEGEHSGHVAQLKLLFDGCDSTSSGFLDGDELTELCRRLQLEGHVQLLQDTLLQPHSYGQVSFQEFHTALLDLLSASVDSSSEDDSSYLEPVVLEEVQPKLVMGLKRYGRRSHPEASLTADSEDLCPGAHRAEVRRSSSLDSVESLKSEEDTKRRRSCSPSAGGEQEEDRSGGHLLAAGGEQEVLLQGATPPLKHRQPISMQDRRCDSTPFLCSTPMQSAELQMASHMSLGAELAVRSASPSLLTVVVGQKVLSRLDDGSGCTSPEKVEALWREEGIRNSREILQTLDFSVDERLSLTDLTLALDNELLVSGNGIHQAALLSYKNEIQHLQELLEAASQQRDKLKADLDQSDHRNLQLIREVDDRHASMENLNQSRIRELEQDFRDRLMAARSWTEQECEALLQQAERERAALQDELQLLRLQDAALQDELSSTMQENDRLHQELDTVRLKLSDAQSSADKLQGELQQLLLHKFGGLDGVGAALSHEERFSEIIREYELQCRKIKELRDRNDELSSEVELLQSQRRSRRPGGHAATQPLHNLDSEDSDMKRSSSPPDIEKLKPVGTRKVLHPGVSIQTELALEQLKQKHDDELHQLNVQLETQVNYYERSLELMRQSMEVERKDISQAFKLEISELEEQKSKVEQQVKQLKDTVDKLSTRLQSGGGGGWNSEQERRMQREQAELEQNFAKEIKNLVDRLSMEKEQQEAELKLKMDQEVQLVRRRYLELEGELEEIITFQESLKALNEHLEEEKSSAEETMRSCEEQLLVEVSQPQEASLSLQRSRREVTDHCSQIRVQRVAELEALQEVQRSSAESPCRLTAESDPLKTARWSGESGERKRSRARQLCSFLQEQHEEVCRLQEENHTYTRLADQFSSQIVEMEEEMCSLKDLLQDLSLKLSASSDLVLDLRVQLNAKTSKEEQLRSVQEAQRAQMLQLQEALQESREQLRRMEEALQESREQLRRGEEKFEEEKKKMRRQLLELEQLVLDLDLDLEEVSEQGGSGRAQLEEERLEKTSLQERLHILQQEVQTLEEEAEKRRRRLQEEEREQQRSKEEQERLQRENSRCREEVLHLSSRNLQLSNDNAALSARLHGDLESIRTLQGRLSAVSREQEEEGLTARRLQDAAVQLQGAWTQEKTLLLEELASCKRQLSRRGDLEAELRSVALKLQQVEDDKTKLLRDIEDRNNKMEVLQHALVSMETEAERLRLQVHAIKQEQLGHAHQVSELQLKLQQAQDKVEELQSSVRRLLEEKEELRQMLEEQQEQEETHKVGTENQILKLSEEQQSIRSRLKLEEEAHLLAQDQALRANAALSLMQKQLQRVQEAQQEVHQQAGDGCRQQVELLELHLEGEQKRCHQLEEALKLQSQEQQGQYEKMLLVLQQRSQELEVKLKGVRLLLQEKVQQLQQELAKSSTCSVRLKEAYVENSQLMAALSITERRQKEAEKKNHGLEDTVDALKMLLKEVVTVILAT